MAAGRRIAVKQSTSRDPEAVVADPVADGRRCGCGTSKGGCSSPSASATASLPFSSWAALLRPRPFVARHSGVATFHLAATDDGRIDAAEQSRRVPAFGPPRAAAGTGRVQRHGQARAGRLHRDVPRLRPAGAAARVRRLLVVPAAREQGRAGRGRVRGMPRLERR